MKDKKNKLITLIICTVGEIDNLKKLLESLQNQEYKKFEVIIVDQNEDKRVDEIIKNHKLDIKLIKSEKGLSLSRNKGLENFNGKIVAFPDDDCIYPKDLLKNVNDFFNSATRFVMKSYDMLKVA